MPVILRVILFSFFEKKLTKNYLLTLLAGITSIQIYIFPNREPLFLGVYFLVVFAFLIVQLRKLAKQRGISFSYSGTKVSWFLTFFILNTFIPIALIVQSRIPPTELLIPVNFLIIFLSTWYFSIGPEAFRPLSQESKYPHSILDQKEKYRILSDLDRLLLKENYFLNPDASLSGLARKLLTSPHQLSQVINETKGMTFFDLMAYHRVMEAKKLLRNEQMSYFKIEEIGERVGYMSKSSFNTVFKKFVGKTPSEYRDRSVRDYEVERPGGSKSAPFEGRDRTFDQLQITLVMLKEFISIYWRSLGKNRLFSVVKFTGLVVGFSSALMIYLYIQDELSYDKFHNRNEDIYRIALMGANPQTRTPHPMAQALVKEFPDVEGAVTLTPLYGPGLTKQSLYIRNPETDVLFQVPEGYAVDTTFFDVFDFELIVGNEKESLNQLGGLILSESLARKFFGDENPLGKVLEIDTEGHSVVVTGVMKEVEHSHFHPGFILSYVTLKYLNPGNPWLEWQDFGHFNYVKLHPGTNPAEIEARLPQWMFEHGALTEQNLAAFTSGEYRLVFQPLTDIHLKSHIRWELEANGNITYIYILMGAILFILIISSINFINVSTARALERTKEIGVRRTLGAGKLNIVFQFLSESIVSSLLALTLAFACSALLLNEYNQLTEKSFSLSELLSSRMIILGIAFAMGVGIIAGIIPAFLASSLKVTEVIKGKFTKATGNNWVRKSLIILQFTVSAILIFGSVILSQQVEFLENKSLGFNEEQVLIVDLKSDRIVRSLPTLKNEILKIQGVESVGALSNIPGTQFDQNAVYAVDDPDLKVDVSEFRADMDVDKPFGFQIVAGRWFDRSNQVDSAGLSFIINETAVRELGLKDPINTKIVWDDDDPNIQGTVIGVVKDFHFQSLHVPIRPLLIVVDYDDLTSLTVSIKGSNITSTVGQIQKTYETFDNRFGFDATFLDQKNQQLYESEKRSLRIFNLFTLIALSLGAMGLLGLAYLMIIQRIREIGIRKILGASILTILLKENLSFQKLVLFGVLIGLPIATLVMKSWLEGFAYRIEITPWAYGASFLIAAGVTFVSVSLAILRTVFVSPSEALRHE